jgi:hypothetical protein
MTTFPIPGNMPSTPDTFQDVRVLILKPVHFRAHHRSSDFSLHEHQLANLDLASNSSKFDQQKKTLLLHQCGRSRVA